MRCIVDRDRHGGRLVFSDISEHARDNPDSITVPIELLNAVQTAQFELNRAEARVLERLVAEHPDDTRYRRWLDDLNASMLS